MISVIIATIGRDTFELVKSRVENADEIIVVQDDVTKRRELVSIINEGVSKAKGDIIGLVGERILLYPDWKDKVLDAFKRINNHGVVSCWENIVISGFISRSFIDKELGGNVFHPDYIHYCCDIELGDVARKCLSYVEIPFVTEKQFEKDYKTNPYSGHCAQFDRETYELRSREGWPNRRLRTEEEKNKILCP